MADAKAIIRIGAMPDSSLRKALGETMAAAARAGKQSAAAEIAAAKQAEREKIRAAKAAERAAKEASQAAIRAAQAHQREVQKAASAEVRAAQAAAKAKAREAEKLAREQARWDEWAERLKYRAVQASTRAAERAAAQQRRESERTARQQIRDAAAAGQARQDGRRRILAAAGGAAVGIASSALGRARSFAGTFGARSNEDMAASAIDFQRRLRLLGDMGGMDAAGQAELQKKILATSAKSGLDAGDVLGGLERAQDRFTALKEFAAIIDDIAKVSVATGTDIESVVGAMGVMRRQFQLTDEEMVQLSGAMVTAADLGNVSFQAVADNFASALGGMARNANMQGMGGAIKGLALSQIMGAADKTAPETATLITNMMASLSKQEVRQAAAASKAAGGFGVRLSENGALRDLPTIIRELSAAGFMAPENSALRGAVFRDHQAREAMEVLVTQFERDPETVTRLLGMQTEEGRAAIDRRFATMNEGVLGQAATLGARQFENFMNSGEFDRFIGIAVKSADSLTQLEAKYPLIKEAVGIAADALKGLGAAILAEKLLMGGATVAGAAGVAGAGAAAAGGGAAAAGAVGTAGAAAGVAGGIGAAGVLGAAGAGVAGYAFGTALLELFGLDAKKLGSGVYDAMHYEHRSKTRGIPTASGPGEPVLYSDAADSDFVSREPVPWSPVPVTMPPEPKVIQPQASLTITVKGDAKVLSTESDGFESIELMSVDTGRRSSI